MDWPSLLGSIFDKAGVSTLKESKILKKATAKAAKSTGQAEEQLRASLQAFLRGGRGGFQLEGRHVIKGKKKTGKKEHPAVGAAGAGAAPEEPASSPPPKKKQKRTREAGSGAKQQHQQQVDVPGAGSKGKQKEKRGKKRQAGDGKAESEEREQQHAQPPAGGEQQQAQPAAKRRKKAADGSSAAAAAGGTGRGGGGAEDASEVRWRQSEKRRDVKSGPFSKAEKETLRQAVQAYAAKHGHSTDSYEWLYTTSKSGSTSGAWKKIAAALPHRTIKAVWAAGTRMFHEGNYQGKWSPEEDAQLLQLVSERGRRWKEIGGAVGRMPEACRDRWLMIRQGDTKKQGRWSEHETERLRDAVQEYLAAKTAAEARMAGGGAGSGAGEEETATLTLEDIEGAAQEPAVDVDGAADVTVSRRIILDDIDWNVVSQAVGTRSNVQCLEKWYTQLSPSMVARGEWGSGDDRRLLRALYLSGAAHDYELDWGDLVRGRTAQQARRRWRLMIKAVPDSRDLEFGELVEALVERFMPQLKVEQQHQQGEEQDD